MSNIASGDVESKILFEGYRFIIAGAIVLVIVGFTKRNIFALSKRSISELFVLGVFQTTLQYIFFYLGIFLFIFLLFFSHA